MNVLIIGRHQALFDFMAHLTNLGHHTVVGIVTAPARSRDSRTQHDFHQFATAASIPFLEAMKIDDGVVSLIDSVEPEIAFSMNWPTIIPSHVLARLPYGFINGHFGDLPRYRGNGLAWALLRNEPTMTLTVYRMEGDVVDTGIILAKQDYPLNEYTTIKDINDFMAEQLPKMFLDVLDTTAGQRSNYAHHTSAQNGFRAYPILPLDGIIDFNQDAERIDNLIRSFTKPFSGAYTYYWNDDDLIKLYVWESRVVCKHTEDVAFPGHVLCNDAATGEAWVMTGSGVIAFRAISYGADGEMLRPGEVWSGNRKRLGINVQDTLYKLVHIFKARTEHDSIR